MPRARTPSTTSTLTRLKKRSERDEKELDQQEKELESRRDKTRRRIRARKAVLDLEEVRAGKKVIAKSKGKKTVEERAVKAASDVLNDGLPERDTSQLIDPHLKDLYAMRERFKGMMDRAFDTVKTVESGLHQRDAYTAIAVARDYREIISEIRAIEDQNQFATTVFDKVIAPLTARIYQNLSDTMFALRNLLQQELGAEGYKAMEPRFQALMIEHGRYMQQGRDETRAVLDSIFVVQ